MQKLTTDVAVIGAGTAGLAAYRAAVAGGARALIIEGGAFGTTCARVGCMPSKLMIAAADAAHVPAKWPEFGLRLQGSLEIDGRAVMERIRRERDRFVALVLDTVESIPDADRVRGAARFVDNQTLQIDQHTMVAFERAVIATGSSPVVPASWQHLGKRLIVNDDIFSWEDLPRSVAVFGPGVVGLELGQALHRLGVSVTMYGRSDHVGPFTDPELHAYAGRVFGAEFPLFLDAQIVSMDPVDSGVAIRRLSATGSEQTILVDYVIAAVGRKPNVRGLDLSNADVPLDGQGLPRFDRSTMQIGSTNIFIAGDVGDDAPLLHEANDEGRLAGDNAARYPHVRAGLRRAPLAIVFSDPQLTVVGPGFANLQTDTFVVGSASFENQGRSRIMLRNTGLLHVYAERTTGNFLGAEMIGPDAEHLGHLMAWALQMKLTIAQMLAMPFYHPVIEEGLRTALRDAAFELGVAQTLARHNARQETPSAVD
jgi:dihydrolipoamide dehydrogenase